MSHSEIKFRLPIHHPDFQYAPCGNPYAAKIRELAGRAFTDAATEQHRGNWRVAFPDTANYQSRLPETQRELHVELGCNAGHVTLEWAARNPDQAFIGLDWKFKPIFRAAEKALKRNLGNLLFLRAHAERLQFIFAQEEIDRLYLFFPDPWPKKSHWKNRFITTEEILCILPLLKRGGIFHIKTDHPEYFAWIEEALEKARPLSKIEWRVVERNTDLHAGHPAATQLQIPEVTLFERLFIQDGIRIHSLKLQRL
ncbi:MAG TPA: hypothetical protein DCS07_07260 [Bdellovibrionales bacterium]|nr:MAG: hypothetical protein A2Z97_09430 [Bdellovibrionales bacterium GWB1_52_6]OFZ03618.1 MAG: hypothetical protein A2X97_00815 [Bdellovibrionales bacterium GWA1_52_35]OFZ34927.1 MAG: hypothetical protein A2070_14405 [Bdellovibrionales bacterium GWC1_52_8]HAR42417.1 hypothetical protein [Bdellovibrionales bacterium]HCM40658.1 hypothetical protein [Bdellovibrionales bacterium]